METRFFSMSKESINKLIETLVNNNGGIALLKDEKIIDDITRARTYLCKNGRKVILWTCENVFDITIE